MSESGKLVDPSRDTVGCVARFVPGHVDRRRLHARLAPSTSFFDLNFFQELSGSVFFEACVEHVDDNCYLRFTSPEPRATYTMPRGSMISSFRRVHIAWKGGGGGRAGARVRMRPR